MVQPLTEEERAEMKALVRAPQGLLTRADRERLEGLRHQDIDANDDRIAESIEFPLDEGV